MGAELYFACLFYGGIYFDIPHRSIWNTRKDMNSSVRIQPVKTSSRYQCPNPSRSAKTILASRSSVQSAAKPMCFARVPVQSGPMVHSRPTNLNLQNSELHCGTGFQPVLTGMCEKKPRFPMVSRSQDRKHGLEARATARF